MEPRDPPGWYADPLRRFPWRWFDGYGWTSQVSSGGQVMVDPLPQAHAQRPSVDVRWVRVGATILAFEVAVLLAGFVSVVTSDALSYPSSKRDYVCDGHVFELISNFTWIAWLVLVVLAIALMSVWLLRGRGSTFLAISALMSVGGTVVLFPAWLAIGAGADCGL